jgi:hypothetical protein
MFLFIVLSNISVFREMFVHIHHSPGFRVWFFGAAGRVWGLAFPSSILTSSISTKIIETL